MACTVGRGLEVAVLLTWSVCMCGGGLYGIILVSLGMVILPLQNSTNGVVGGAFDGNGEIFRPLVRFGVWSGWGCLIEFLKEGRLRAIQNSTNEVLGGPFRQMRRHLESQRQALALHGT